jgi:hypothetical protein
LIPELRPEVKADNEVIQEKSIEAKIYPGLKPLVRKMPIEEILKAA